jgi:hypothetical protein
MPTADMMDMTDDAPMSSTGKKSKTKKKSRRAKHSVGEDNMVDDGEERSANPQRHADTMHNVPGVERHGKLVFGKYVLLMPAYSMY